MIPSLATKPRRNAITRAVMVVALGASSGCALLAALDDHGPPTATRDDGGLPEAAPPPLPNDSGGSDVNSDAIADGAAARLSAAKYILVRQGKEAIASITLNIDDAPAGTTLHVEAAELPAGITANETGIPDASAPVVDAATDADAGATTTDAAPPPSPNLRYLRFVAAANATQGSFPIKIRAIATPTTPANAVVAEITATLLVGGAAGTLDLSFGGGDGYVFTRVRGPDDEATNVVVQADGKIVVAVSSAKIDSGALNADFVLVRYSPDGVLDPSFGAGGIVSTDIAANLTDQSRALAQQSDGKLVLGGTRQGQFAAARYKADGTLDPQFGDGGVALVPPINASWSPIVQAVSIQENASIPQSNGTIVLAGSAYTGVTSTLERYMMRLTPSGELDLSFGNGGSIVPGMGPKDDQFMAVAHLADGKIVAHGYYVQGASPFNPFPILSRFNNDGTFDMTFTGSGNDFFSFVPGYGRAMAITADGKLALAIEQGGGFGAARCLAGGASDLTFAGDGIETFSIGLGASAPYALAVDQSDSFVLAGYAIGTNRDIALARITTAGVLDTTFGGGGKVTTPIGLDDEARALTLAPDGRILVGGFTTQPDGKQVLILRYWQ